MGLAWLLIAGAIALISLIFIIVIRGAGVVFDLAVWLLTQIGVLFIRLLGLIVRGCRRLIDRIRDVRP